MAMVHRWDPRSPEPRELVVPVPVDPTGRAGPTRGQARGPYWRAIGGGLYVPSDVAAGRVEQRILEASVRLPAGALVSGWAALRLHRVNFCDGRDRALRELPVPVVVPRTVNVRVAGVATHRESVPEGERTSRYGVACTTVERALFDAMKWSDDERAAVALADMTFAAHAVRRDDFLAYVAARRGDRGSRRVRAAVALSDDGSLSPPETTMRLVWVLDAGLPAPRCNWYVVDSAGRRVGRPDLLSEELGVVGEYDGAEHAGSRRRSHDATKEDAYRNLGLESFRIVGRDLDDPALVVARMRAAVRRVEESGRPRLWRSHPPRTD
jgi:hypothetical protein